MNEQETTAAVPFYTYGDELIPLDENIKITYIDTSKEDKIISLLEQILYQLKEINHGQVKNYYK